MRSPIAGYHVVSNKTCRRSPVKGASPQVLIFALRKGCISSGSTSLTTLSLSKD